MTLQGLLNQSIQLTEPLELRFENHKNERGLMSSPSIG